MLTATSDAGVCYQTFTLHHTKYICLSTYALTFRRLTSTIVDVPHR